MTHPSGLLTAEEVAEVLRVAPLTIRRWVASGKLAAIKLPGGQIRVRKADVESILSGAA